MLAVARVSLLAYPPKSIILDSAPRSRSGHSAVCTQDGISGGGRARSIHTPAIHRTVAEVKTPVVSRPLYGPLNIFKKGFNKP